jgi:ribosomal protein S12 methylthiotransferase accessory factor YcaO
MTSRSDPAEHRRGFVASMSTSLVDSLIPPTPGLADGFRLEILNHNTIAFRSASRLHFWSGGIYRDIGLALGKGSPSGRILATLAPKHGAPEAVLALCHLTRHSIVRQASGPEGTRSHDFSPEIFGDPDAPYRTFIAFESRPGLPASSDGPGFYVFGRGLEATTARIGCLAEAAERRSLYAIGRRHRVRLSAEELREAAVPPRSLLNAGEPGFEEQPLDWTPAYSLVSRSIRYLPAEFCFAGWGKATRIGADSTGCAAGPNPCAAALSGFFELVERDALRRWWLDGKPGRPVRTESFEASVLEDVRRYLAGRGRTLVVIDITAIPEVPAFAALSFQKDARCGVLGASAHFDPLTAMTSAILETGLALNWSSLVRYGSRSLTPEIVLRPGGPVEWSRLQDAGDYHSASVPNAAVGLARAAALMGDHGKDLLVVDLAAPGATFSTVRVTVPGLRRFNPGTIYALVESASRWS